MRLRQLEFLCALAREGHFGRAAETCHVSQPALSASIRKLEGELGVQIVKRAQKFEGFTAEGQLVLDWAQQVVAGGEDLRQQLRSLRDGIEGTLRLGAIPTALSIVPLLTTALRETHRGVAVSVSSMSSRDIVSNLADFSIDVGLSYVDGEPLGKVRTLKLYQERYLFLTPARRAYDGAKLVSWQEAAQEPLCLLDPIMQNRCIIDGHFAAAGADPHVVVETDAVSAIFAHVSEMGLSTVIPHAWLQNFDIPERLKLFELEPPQRAVHVGLVLPHTGRDSLLARAMVDTVRTIGVTARLDQLTCEWLAKRGC